MNPVEEYILNQKEPTQSIMLYLRQIILETLPKVDEKYKWKIPFYYSNGNGICYLNVLKGTNYVDLGFIAGFKLSNKQGLLKAGRNRKMIKSIEYYSLEHIDIKLLKEILKEASSL